MWIQNFGPVFARKIYFVEIDITLQDKAWVTLHTSAANIAIYLDLESNMNSAFLFKVLSDFALWLFR